jgi:hypothetical protein
MSKAVGVILSFALFAAEVPASAQSNLACPSDWAAAVAEAPNLQRIAFYEDEFESEGAFEPAGRLFLGRPVWRIYLTQDPLGDTISYAFPAGTNVLPALLRRAYGAACSEGSCSFDPPVAGGLRGAYDADIVFYGEPAAVPAIQCLYNID